MPDRTDRSLFSTLGVTLLALFAGRPMLAADGGLDPSFWGDGRYVASTAPDNLLLYELVESPDQALVWVGTRVVSGAQSVARWRRLGDTVESGCELVLEAGVSSHFYAADFDATGRLVVAGWAVLADDSYRLLFARYFYPSCVLDDDFADGGVLRVDTGNPDWSAVHALATDGDAIVFAGVVQLAGLAETDGLVGRLLADGAPDPAFAGDGLLYFDGRAGHDQLSTIALAPGGRIYVGGNGELPDGSNANFYLLALQANGSPVPGFGLDGLVRVDFPDLSSSPTAYLGKNGLTLLADGRIVLAGQASSDSPSGYAGALAMFGPQGLLDPGFGVGGRVVDEDRAFFTAALAQGNGRFVLAGADSYPSSSYSISRRLATGAPDPTFAGGAAVPVSFPEGGHHVPWSIALQAGRVVVGGTLYLQPSSGAVTRLKNAYLFADGFEIGSTWFWSAALP